MALVNVKAESDTSALDERDKRFREAPARMQTLQKSRAKQSTRRIRFRFAAPDDDPALPLIWSTDPSAQRRARAYYFAVKVPKGSKGGRYKRTGELEAGWEVVFTVQGTGGVFTAENPSDAIDYVYGPRQVPSHYLTGWEDLDNVLEAESDVIMHDLIDDWFYVTTKAG